MSAEDEARTRGQRYAARRRAVKRGGHALLPHAAGRLLRRAFLLLLSDGSFSEPRGC